jgi:hypothetical protein
MPSDPVPGELGWYEVDRVGDLEGNETRTLLVGSLGGTVVGRIPLGSQAPVDRRDGREAWAWTDPQADGIFGGMVLVWGRDGNPTIIEAVDVSDGSIAPIVEAPGDTVHVATGSSTLSHVFFVTVDAASNRPTGLWVFRPGESAPPRQLSYRFAPDAVTNLFGYRLAANSDGSRLAVQPGGEGPTTLIDVEGDVSFDVMPGGPIVGFADGDLIAFGPRSGSGSRAVLAFDGATLRQRQIAEDANAAQAVRGTAGDIVAVMVSDPSGSSAFDILSLVAGTGDGRVAYTHEPPALAQHLPRRDISSLGAELPEDWVILVDSFLPFIEGPGESPNPVSEAGYPTLLNLRTSETLVVGPFVDHTSS